MARPHRAASSAKPAPDDEHRRRTDRHGCLATSSPASTPRMSAKTPIRMAPSGTRARFGLPWLARAASPEPIAMPITKVVRPERHHAFGAADMVLDQGRQQRQRHRADQPEPGDDVRAAPQPLVAPELAQQRERRCPRIARDGEVGRGRSGRGDGARERPRHDRQRQNDGNDDARGSWPRPRQCRRRWCRSGWQGTSRLPPARCRRAARRSGASPAGCRTSPGRTAPRPCRTAPSVTNRIGTECR